MDHYLINLTVLALVIGANSTYVNADDEVVDNSWMSPIAREFSELDISGNGLLNRHEASKGNAFNNKSFSEADINKDDGIDLDEYIYYKKGKWPSTEDRVEIDPEQVSQFIKGSSQQQMKLYI